MKTIFITGASAGLGKTTAKLFHSRGWRVIATMRKPEKEKELGLLKNVTLLPMDITDPEQIAATAANALAQADIDVVFNNAGYGLVGPLESCSDEQIRDQIDTNFLGTLRVTKAFIPSFREKRSGMFITTTSLCGVSSNPLSSVYNGTKWALEGWSESISYDLKNFGISIKTVAPGGIKSNFMNAMKVTSDPAYDRLSERMSELFADGTLMEFTDVENIAAVVYEAATDGKDQLRYLAGEDAKRVNLRRLELGSENYRRNLNWLLFESRKVENDVI